MKGRRKNGNEREKGQMGDKEMREGKKGERKMKWRRKKKGDREMKGRRKNGR